MGYADCAVRQAVFLHLKWIIYHQLAQRCFVHLWMHYRLFRTHNYEKRMPCCRQWHQSFPLVNSTVQAPTQRAQHLLRNDLPYKEQMDLFYTYPCYLGVPPAYLHNKYMIYIHVPAPSWFLEKGTQLLRDYGWEISVDGFLGPFPHLLLIYSLIWFFVAAVKWVSVTTTRKTTEFTNTN